MIAAMKKILLLPFLILLCFRAAGQTGGLLYIDTSIHPHRDDTLNFASVHVLSDGMDDTVFVAYPMLLHTDRRPELLLDMPTLCPQAESFLHANAGNPAGPKLTMILRRFRIGEAFVSRNPLGKMDLIMMQLRIVADFYEEKNGALQFLYSVDTLYERRPRIFNENHVGRFVSLCLLDMAQDACNHLQEARSKTFTEAEAIDKYRALRRRYAIYANKNPLPSGMYARSDDYLNLHPSDTSILFEHIPQLTGDGVNNFYARGENGKKGERLSAEDYFAASDGKTVYISWAGTWHKAVISNGEYGFFSLTRGLAESGGTGYYSVGSPVSAVATVVAGVTVAAASGEFGQNGGTQGKAVMYYLMQYSLPHRKWIRTSRKSLSDR